MEGGRNHLPLLFHTLLGSEQSHHIAGIKKGGRGGRWGGSE